MDILLTWICQAISAVFFYKFRRTMTDLSASRMSDYFLYF